MEKVIQAQIIQLQDDPWFSKSLSFQEIIKHMDVFPFSEAIQVVSVPEWFTRTYFKGYKGKMKPITHF